MLWHKKETPTKIDKSLKISYEIKFLEFSCCCCFLNRSSQPLISLLRNVVCLLPVLYEYNSIHFHAFLSFLLYQRLSIISTSRSLFFVLLPRHSLLPPAHFFFLDRFPTFQRSLRLQVLQCFSGCRIPYCPRSSSCTAQ